MTKNVYLCTVLRKWWIIHVSSLNSFKTKLSRLGKQTFKKRNHLTPIMEMLLHSSVNERFNEKVMHT